MQKDQITLYETSNNKKTIVKRLKGPYTHLLIFIYFNGKIIFAML